MCDIGHVWLKSKSAHSLLVTLICAQIMLFCTLLTALGRLCFTLHSLMVSAFYPRHEVSHNRKFLTFHRRNAEVVIKDLIIFISKLLNALKLPKVNIVNNWMGMIRKLSRRTGSWITDNYYIQVLLLNLTFHDDPGFCGWSTFLRYLVR